jgi:hypothetical protein
MENYNDEWTEFRINWGSDNTINCKWLDKNNNELVSLKGTDSDHDGKSGIVLTHNHSGTSGSCTHWWDEIKIS